MPSDVQVVFNGGGGSRAGLTIEIGVFGAQQVRVHRRSACAISYACDWVRKTLAIEAPEPLFSWSLDPPPPEIDGFSIFGSVAAALLQACVREGMGCPDQMRGGTRALLPTIAAARLDNVAISAERNDTEDGFTQVGKIEEKLRSLAGPGLANPACVLAWDQERPIWKMEQWDGNTWAKVCHDAPARLYERWQVPRVERPLPIIRAHDPLDAVARVFELHRNNVARNVLPFVKASAK
jgi:hypothetical protein